MLGDNYQSKQKSSNLFFLLIGTKILRIFIIGLFFWGIVFNQIPILVYLFLILLVASLMVVSSQKPWSGNTIILDSSNYLQLCLYSALYLLSLILWTYGLSFLGPVRTILATDYLDVVVIFIGSIIFSEKRDANIDKKSGIFLTCLGYAFLVFTETNWYSQTSFPSSPSKLGIFFLFAGTGILILTKKFGQDFEDQVGPKKLYASALPLATVMLFPFALIQAFTTTSEYSIFNFSTLVNIFLIATVQFSMNFYIDILTTHRKIRLSITAPASLASSFVPGILLEWAWGISALSFSTLFSFIFLFVGIRMLFKKNIPELEEVRELPLYSSQVVDIFSLSFLRISMRQILDNSESRRIFSYLCINLMFMFIEMLYGILTNSLGLISDGCHMLFDCTALVIGLYASVISKLPSNKVYSYGYGRVEVLSGFINGVFLVFIAFLVLLESAERLLHPQEIKTDKLLLVSCLGLGVNLIGVFAFHDLHGHGEDDGHSHSHGDKKKKKEGNDHHDHSHSHGEKKEKREKKDAHSHKEKKENHNEGNSNLYGVYLHIIADTLGSVGVIISSILIEWKGWIVADPICSLCISILIFVGVLPLLQSSSSVLLQSIPNSLELKIESALNHVRQIESVVGWSDPHFWKQASGIVVGTIHIQTTGEIPDQKILKQVTEVFHKKGINNLTVEITHQTYKM